MRGLIAVCAMLAGGTIALAQSPALHATVQVTVLDANDLPVGDALAAAYPQGVAMASAPEWCRTNLSGVCSLELHSAGQYAILASKEQDGYPRQYPFYTGLNVAPQAMVNITAGHFNETVVTHLGKRAGILIGTVRDAETGKPLNANVEFRWVAEPSNFLSGSGLTNATFRILVPADAPLTMVVSLDGYENWRYMLGPGEARDALLVKPGEELTLDIRLWPKK